MLLNMADFGKSWKSLQTLWNASKSLPKLFLTLCGTCYADLGWIRKGRKSADFEQKAWAIAHAFEHGGFWQVLEIAPNSLKRLQIPSKIISDSLRDLVCRFGVNSQGSKIGRFWAKTWAIAHAFEHGGFWQVLEIAPNSLKRLQIPSKIISDSLRDLVCRFGVNSQGSKIGRFWAKTWAIAHGFEHGGFWQVLEIAPNSLKRLQISSKIISDSLRACYVDLGWIRKGRKLADFEQKAWAIAHAFEHGGFWQVLESLQTLWNASKSLLK